MDEANKSAIQRLASTTESAASDLAQALADKAGLQAKVEKLGMSVASWKKKEQEAQAQLEEGAQDAKGKEGNVSV